MTTSGHMPALKLALAATDNGVAARRGWSTGSLSALRAMAFRTQQSTAFTPLWSELGGRPVPRVSTPTDSLRSVASGRAASVGSAVHSGTCNLDLPLPGSMRHSPGAASTACPTSTWWRLVCVRLVASAATISGIMLRSASGGGAVGWIRLLPLPSVLALRHGNPRRHHPRWFGTATLAAVAFPSDAWQDAGGNRRAPPTPPSALLLILYRALLRRRRLGRWQRA
jgi:hypothetical protein